MVTAICFIGILLEQPGARRGRGGAGDGDAAVMARPPKRCCVAGSPAAQGEHAVSTWRGAVFDEMWKRGFHLVECSKVAANHDAYTGVRVTFLIHIRVLGGHSCTGWLNGA